MEFIITSDRHGENEFRVGKVTFTTPVTLPPDTGNPSHAATKQYVDSKFVGLDISTFTEGVLPYSVMPEIVGDLTSPAGAWVFTLSNTGVVPGGYTKFLVDTKGRIKEGGHLTSSDLPNLDWSKIISGKPNSGRGYNIDDGVYLTGDNVINLSTVATQTNASHAATLGYLKSKPKGNVTGDIYQVGDFRLVPKYMRDDTDVSDLYLIANGAQVFKDDHSELYDLIGDRYSKVDYKEYYGKPWTIINTDIYSSLSNMPYPDELFVDSGEDLPIAVANHCVFVTNNKVYMVGGELADGSVTDRVFTCDLVTTFNDDVVLGAWTEVTGTGMPISGSRAAVVGNKVYIYPTNANTVGGLTPYLTVGTFNSQGVIEYWDNSTYSKPPLSLQNADIFALGSYLYVVGDGTGKLHRAKIKENFDLEPFEYFGNLEEKYSGGRVIVAGSGFTLHKTRIVNDTEPHHYTVRVTLGITATDTIDHGYDILSPDVYLKSGPVIQFSYRIIDIPGVSISELNTANTNSVYIRDLQYDTSDNSPIIQEYHWEEGAKMYSQGLPDILSDTEAVVTSSNIFLLGGRLGVGQVPTSQVLIADQLLTKDGNIVYDLEYNMKHKQGIFPNNSSLFFIPDLTAKKTGDSFWYIKARSTPPEEENPG